MNKFIKFGLVGILNTVITIVIFNVLKIFEIDYVIANAIGYVGGMVNSYIWNNKWVFNANSKDISTVGKFIAVNLIVFLINTGILILLVDNMSLNESIAQIIALAVTTVINFLGNKLWTFNK